MIENVLVLLYYVEKHFGRGNMVDGLIELSLVIYTMYALRSSPRFVGLRAEERNALNGIAAKALEMYRNCCARPDSSPLSVSAHLFLS